MAFGGTKSAIGLEIDTGMARAVEAAGSAAKPKLVKLALDQMPEGSMEEGMVIEPQKVGDALSNLWRSGGLKNHRVLLGISNQGVLVRHATIYKVPPDKLDNVIKYTAQEQLPIPLESVVLDYQVIGETTNEENKTMLEILLVAARRDMLNGFLKALQLAKLEPADIDVSILSLMQILPAAALDRTVAVVNVANGLSNILISDRGRPRMARLVSVKLKDLADRFGCSLEDVLEVSDRGAESGQGAYAEWLNSLITEIRSSLNYYQNRENSSPVEAIILNGRGGRIKGIDKRLEKALDLSVRLVNPFAAFNNAGKALENNGIQAVEYAISAGLARRGLEGS